MTPNLSITQQRPLPAFTGWQACFARMEMSVHSVVYIPVAKVNRRPLTQGCYSMTD
jgi:hypothetical protein